MAFSPDELTRYSRHLLLDQFGIAGQEKLQAARVLIIGVGGLGAPAALYLAASGVGTLGLLDCDRVELSNLQRQVLYGVSNIGAPKATSAAQRLHLLNPGTRTIAHDVELRAANAAGIFSGYDLVIDGSDRMATRYLVNDACVLGGKSLITAAIHRFEGQAMTYVPGRGPCYRCLFPDSPDDVPNCAGAGVLGVLPGVLGMIQATEAIKLIAGIGAPLTGRLLTYDALALRFQEFHFTRRRDCAVCGERPAITQLRDADATACDAPSSNDPPLPPSQRLSALQLRALLQAAGAPAPTLIDVREPAEFALGHLPDARNLPLGQLAAHLGELPRDQKLVFVCQSGVRSLQACALAARAGLSAPAQLEGGLQAWAQMEAGASRSAC